MASPRFVASYVRTQPAPVLPPPVRTTGTLGWLRANLFSGWFNTLLTLVCLALILAVLVPLVRFVAIDAVWSGSGRQACLAAPGENVGACWAYVRAYFDSFMYGLYPDAEQWRANLAGILLAGGIAALLIPRLKGGKWGLFYLVAIFPFAGWYLLHGGWGGLTHIATERWGGLLLTLVIAVTGIIVSLPLGILLALGRRSQMSAVRLSSVLFIEIWRGVPLVTVLFMSSVMLPVFLPDGVSFDKLARVLIGIALFSSAYMAEVVRGGLQAVPRGQYEAAHALGLGYWRTMGLVILPQALKLVIPGIVNTFIGLFKDTTLVLIIGLFDLLGMVQLSFADAAWATPTQSYTAYLFVAAVYWVFCFGMSRYSMYMERRLGTGHGLRGDMV